MNVVTGIAMIFAGLAVIWTARKAAAGKLERNWAIGLRTKRLMASEEAWETGHRAAAPMLVGAGAMSVVAGVVVIPQPDDGVVGAAVTLAGAGLLLVMVLLSLRQANRAVEGL
ncbi:MAG: SdpI family protein [Acidimicrobiia bacterium]|nr:SdpI family protein [Acidimicrobiia bacterium]